MNDVTQLIQVRYLNQLILWVVIYLIDDSTLTDRFIGTAFSMEFMVDNIATTGGMVIMGVVVQVCESIETSFLGVSAGDPWVDFP